MTPEQQKEAIRLAGEGAKNSTIAKAIGVNPKTINRWLMRASEEDAKTKYVEFALLFNRARSNHEMALVRQFNEFSTQDLSAAKYLVEKVHGWGDSSVENRIVTRMLEYLGGKIPPELFEEILKEIENGALDDA